MREQIAYAKKPYWITRIHPFVRVYCALALIIAAAAVPHPAQICAVGIPIVALAVMASLPLQRWMLGLYAVVSLIAGLMVLSIISGMSITYIEYEKTAVFIARCLLAFLCSSVLFQTTSHLDVCKALEYARVPILFTVIAGQIFRWVELVRSEAMRMNTARLLRGGNRKSQLGQLKDVTMLLGSLMMRSLSRAERVASAMECRGFNGRLSRSIISAPRACDYAPLAITLAYILASVVAI